MRKSPIVNIYNFVRMSHVEPSRFIQDDFETVKKQLILVKQYGFPSTWALKYDCLMDPRYQALFADYLEETDEVSAWWEITEPLCRKAGVPFRGKTSEEYDDRVNSAYCIGYQPEERKLLVDAYMQDFHEVYGFYPRTIGSWVLDTVTLSYAASRYGILGGAICRDQMGTDGFTLWGGYPNGLYYPSLKNENIPASTVEGQLPVPMFRLLGPDPIYNFEQDVRPGLQGVYTLEPSWIIGRDPDWLAWFFGCLAGEDSLGTGYAHVGQENNFLWENISPGLKPQLALLKTLAQEGKVQVETMADTASHFTSTYRLTPPMTFQASQDWDRTRNLSAQWYACPSCRVGFLGEEGHLRIRDFFLYRQDYPSRYLDAAMTDARSTFDALPVLFPQSWIQETGFRPFIRLQDEDGQEPEGVIRYFTPEGTDSFHALTACAELTDRMTGQRLALFTMQPDALLLESSFCLRFDTLPVFCAMQGRDILMRHRGFPYSMELIQGKVCHAGTDGLLLAPEEGQIYIKLGDKLHEADIFRQTLDSRPGKTSIPGGDNHGHRTGGQEAPLAPDARKTHTTADAQEAPLAAFAQKKRTRCLLPVPPMTPVFLPGASVFPAGQKAYVELAAPEEGQIRYTTDQTLPTLESALYSGPIELTRDTVLSARLITPDGRFSEPAVAEYAFSLTQVQLTSPTLLDPRPIFHGDGIRDLLCPLRGTLDYLDGRWRGTLQDLEVTGTFPEAVAVGALTIGFLSHHRAGIIYPESVQLYTGPDLEHLVLQDTLFLPAGPCAREIARYDARIPVHDTIGAFCLVAHRYPKMPNWCCYKGVASVFTMADNLIITPDT